MISLLESNSFLIPTQILPSWSEMFSNVQENFLFYNNSSNKTKVFTNYNYKYFYNIFY